MGSNVPDNDEFERLIEQFKAKGLMPDDDFVFYYSMFDKGHGFQLTQQVLIDEGGDQQSMPCLVCERCRIENRSVVLSTQRAIREHVMAHYERGERPANDDPVAYLEDLFEVEVGDWPEDE